VIDVRGAVADTSTQGEFFQGRARLIALPRHVDPRGDLIPFNFDDLPFIPRHAFAVRDVPAGTTRGGHALRSAQQILICLAGQLRVLLRDRATSETIILDNPDTALLISAGLWAEQTYLAPDTVMLVFSSEPFNPENYAPKPI
jgi:dTDP-4-dehydrorhamnose 3,5-epimerase-like enzyme